LRGGRHAPPLKTQFRRLLPEEGDGEIHRLLATFRRHVEARSVGASAPDLHLRAPRVRRGRAVRLAARLQHSQEVVLRAGNPTGGGVVEHVHGALPGGANRNNKSIDTPAVDAPHEHSVLHASPSIAGGAEGEGARLNAAREQDGAAFGGNHRATIVGIACQRHRQARARDGHRSAERRAIGDRTSRGCGGRLRHGSRGRHSGHGDRGGRSRRRGCGDGAGLVHVEAWRAGVARRKVKRHGQRCHQLRIRRNGDNSSSLGHDDQRLVEAEGRAFLHRHVIAFDREVSVGRP